MTRCGFRLSGLFVMDGSRRSAHGNAYFTGFRRVPSASCSSTPCSTSSPRPRSRRCWPTNWVTITTSGSASAVIGAGSLAFFALLGHLAGQAFLQRPGDARPAAPRRPWCCSRWPAGVHLPLTPLMSRWSSPHEFGADAYAAATPAAEAAVSALVKLYRDNASTLTPDRCTSSVYDSPPPAAIRIARLQELLPVETTRHLIAAFGRQYEVRPTTAKSCCCVPRGKKSVFACGDRVQVAGTGPGQGVIDKLIERTSLLYRSDAWRQKLIAANATQVVMVVATEPSFSDEFVSRCVCAAEASTSRC